MKCQFCGMELPEGAVFCGYCGQSQKREQFCMKCGEKIADGMIFCLKCGTKVGQVSNQPQPEIENTVNFTMPEQPSQQGYTQQSFVNQNDAMDDIPVAEFSQINQNTSATKHSFFTPGTQPVYQQGVLLYKTRNIMESISVYKSKEISLATSVTHSFGTGSIKVFSDYLSFTTFPVLIGAHSIYYSNVACIELKSAQLIGGQKLYIHFTLKDGKDYCISVDTKPEVTNDIYELIKLQMTVFR